MADKSIYTREKINDKKIRLVIVRIDYISDCSFQKLVSLFDDSFKKSFSTQPERFANHNIQTNMSYRDLSSISRNVKVPIEDIKELEYIRYSGYKKGNCEARFDISQHYMCLTIKCEGNYDGIEEYVEPIKGIITILTNKHINTKLKRLGIRKIRVEDFYHPYTFNNVFEPFVFTTPSFGMNKKNLKSEYFDAFFDPNSSIKVNVKRIIERNVDANHNPILTTTLDIDTYYHLDETNKVNIRSLLDNANNKEFEIYKDCMTYEYLKSIYG